MKKYLDWEWNLWKENPLIAGVDEAGRGALCGPIVVAVVILPIWFKDIKIQDSKILSSKQRAEAYEIIKQHALDYQIGIVDVSSIESENPSRATKNVILQVVKNLKIIPDLCLVDGKEKINIGDISALSIVGGDHKSVNIAAASIVAKVTRDNIMKELHYEYPVYGWFFNKGYADKKHLLAIFDFGFCEFHRKNYDPVKSLLKSNSNKELLKKKYSL